VDNSCKWAGGGFLSSVQDLVKFGTAMLYSHQKRDDLREARTVKEVDFRSELHAVDHQVGPYDNVNKTLERNLLPGFLKSETMQQLWTPMTERYGLGWAVQPRLKEKGYCREESFHALHTGGAVGATSVLLVLPREGKEGEGATVRNPPQGVVVAILCNLESASGLAALALDIAKEFEKLPPAGGPHLVHKLHTC
jgi:serine beta-lactamase-like protein LACTB